jgi:hypothetical protein
VSAVVSREQNAMGRDVRKKRTDNVVQPISTKVPLDIRGTVEDDALRPILIPNTMSLAEIMTN